MKVFKVNHLVTFSLDTIRFSYTNLVIYCGIPDRSVLYELVPLVAVLQFAELRTLWWHALFSFLRLM